MENRKWTY